jgi:hypothetical protein
VVLLGTLRYYYYTEKYSLAVCTVYRWVPPRA